MILITRPQPHAAETARRIEAMHKVPLIAPMLEVATLCDPIGIDESLQAVLVTSSNALSALMPGGVKLLAVGDATAARARQAGHMSVHSAAGDASALVELACQLCAPADGDVLLVSGEGQGAPVAAELRRRGFTVLHRAVYRAAPAAALPPPARQALAAGAVQAALFFSADTARRFVHLAVEAGLRDAATDVEALAISAATATALAPLPWRRIRVALRPNQDDLLALLQ
jgi:uroporphyrinogen-III synthase